MTMEKVSALPFDFSHTWYKPFLVFEPPDFKIERRADFEAIEETLQQLRIWSSHQADSEAFDVRQPVIHECAMHLVGVFRKAAWSGKHFAVACSEVLAAFSADIFTEAFRRARRQEKFPTLFDLIAFCEAEATRRRNFLNSCRKKISDFAARQQDSAKIAAAVAAGINQRLVASPDLGASDIEILRQRAKVKLSKSEGFRALTRGFVYYNFFQMDPDEISAATCEIKSDARIKLAEYREARVSDFLGYVDFFANGGELSGDDLVSAYDRMSFGRLLEKRAAGGDEDEFVGWLIALVEKFPQSSDPVFLAACLRFGVYEYDRLAALDKNIGWGWAYDFSDSLKVALGEELGLEMPEKFLEK